MWTANPRYLVELERLWIKKFEPDWPDDYLDAVQVVDCIVDNAHTIRSATLTAGSVTLAASQLSNDKDGALIDVILYETIAGDFGELEFNRVDTRPLMAIPKPDL
ncbi:hypothetical protein D0Y60_08275 [Shinella sp. WSJ-2]|uniref:hypothetical protein n=1 Tax=Shinella sp. WSJ-2 TaxID=2303749 RepID=UPI000E3B8025|nr:hypothetical protein [Shinella sp. WSJ-2]MBO9629004.1 hypothetical protein [Shinella sp.]RFZ87860.1 hypothetical protein D0Y60_08275 [Shinella sp. WSJ-2]